MKTDDKVFRVDGYTFRVTPSGTLQYLMPNFEGTALNGLGSVWKTLGKVALVAGAGYGVYSVATASGSNIFDKISSAASSIGSKISAVLPSAATLEKAAGIATSIYGAQLAYKQQAAQLKAGVQVAQAQQEPERGGYPITDANQAPIMNPDGSYGIVSDYNANKISNKNLLLFGGGALVLLFVALRK